MRFAVPLSPIKYPVIVRDGDKFLFVVVFRQTKNQFSAYSASLL